MLSTTSLAITKIQTIEGITEYQLENGLQILLIPDASKPSMAVNMTYRVGSRYEQYGRTGMAHLLEHLVFRGTAQYPDALQQFSQKGLSANGSTNQDRTNYYAIFSASDETLEWYLRWQADVMQNITIADADLKKEIDIVLNERERSQNDPMQVLYERLKATSYQWNNSGMAIIGAPDNLKNMRASELLAFYHQYYQPDNATLIIAGQFDEAKTLQLVDSIFSPIAKPTRVLQIPDTLEPVQDGERFITLRQTTGQPFIANVYHIPSAASRDFVALDMAVNMLSDHPSGTIYRHLVQEQKLATNTFGSTDAHYQGGLALFGAQLSKNEDIDAAQQALNQLVENLATHPFSEEELKRSRTYWLNQWEKLYANTELLSIGLSEAIAAGDWRLFFLERDYVKSLTLAQVQSTAEKYFIPTNRSTGQYIPTEKVVLAPATTPPDLTALLANYQGNAISQSVAAFDTSADNIQAHTLHGSLTLDNGIIHYALLPKPTRGNRVFANYRIKFSQLEKLAHQATLSSFAASLMMSGTTSLSQQDIQDKIDALNGTLSYHISANQLVVTLSTTQDYLADLLALSLDIIHEANYPEEEFQNFVAQVRRAIKTNSEEPGAKAAQALNRYLSSFPADDFRYVLTPEEHLAALDAITRKHLIEFNRQNFGAGNIDIAVVGRFEPQTVLDILSDRISSWKKAPEYHYIADPYEDYPSKEFILHTPNKPNGVFLGKLLLPIQNTHPDYPALVMANYLLGGSEASRLFQSIRADKGLSYSITSHINASSFEPSAEWTIQAIYSPSNREAIKKTLADTINSVQQSGFTQEELNKGIQAVINLRALSRSQDSALSATWLRYLESGRDFTWHKRMEESFKSLTLEQVNAAAKKYLNFSKMSKAFADSL
ncbi:M16 family metallopeptidase [Pelistega europaea]|uniref:Insulinase family protein n=1 Tax=Pelistega europaea TaxID=106147 RepID=A0A7Y4P5X8_9BURK|nr:pitrilysin family protein [Pelistega europaea]NOL49185.1 insulinase family protein [Pelistega europaea]